MRGDRTFFAHKINFRSLSILGNLVRRMGKAEITQPNFITHQYKRRNTMKYICLIYTPEVEMTEAEMHAEIGAYMAFGETINTNGVATGNGEALQPTMTATFAQTGAQADDAKRAPLAGDRAHQGRAVDCVGDRAVHDGLDARLGQHRHPGNRAF